MDNNPNIKLQEQAKIVEQRLWYHFANTNGEFNIPEGIPFIKENDQIQFGLKASENGDESILISENLY